MLPDSSHARGPGRNRPRRAKAALPQALLLALLFSLVAPVVAYAHGALRRAVPASNARLSAAPRELRLTFTERVELSVARITLAGPGGAAVELAPLTAVADSANVIVTAIRGALAAGAYTVTWQIAGRDGHPVRGRYTFTVLPGASGLAGSGATTRPDTAAPPGAPAVETTAGEAGVTVTAPGQAPPPAAHHPTSDVPAVGDFDAESPAYVAVRWLTYAALLVVLGAVAFRSAVLGLMRRARGKGSPAEGIASSGFAPDAERRAAALGLWGALALLVAAAARLGAQSVAMHGAAEALDPSRIGAMLRHTVWGWGWLLQLGGAILASLGFAAARRRASSGTPVATTGGAWTAASLAALLLAFTPALSGHAAAAPRLTPLAVLSDGLHVLGAGGWLGSLLVVLAAGIPAAFALGAERRGAVVAALVNAFSPTALGFAIVVAATGVFAGWLHVGRLAALWGTGYGQLLLAKLAVLSLVAATGAYNWLRVRPALGDDAGAARIRRSATAELAVGVLVLLATAALVATPTPMDDAMASAGEGTPMSHAAAGGR
jgi:putative copper export protein/methionine-rich copper-binding protein CopC